MREQRFGFPTLPDPSAPDVSCSLTQPVLASEGPLHAQLASALRQAIATREWRQGDAIPSESELMARYGLSRGTVRRAIRTLVEEGLLVSRKGSGTFVTEGGLARPSVLRPLSFATLLHERGVAYVTEVLAKEVVEAPRSVASELGIAPSSPALFMRRLRSSGGSPLLCQESWSNLCACPGLDEADFARESLFDAVERCSGRRILRSSVRYLSCPVDEEHAAYLGCDDGDPILVLEQNIQLEDGTPIEWSLTWLGPGQSVAGISFQDDGAVLLGGGIPPVGAADGRALRRRLELGALGVRRGVAQIAHRYSDTPFHMGGALSMAELVAVLLGDVMRTGRDGTPWERRDRLVVSKAHCSIALYPAMLEAGLICQDDLDRGLFGPEAVLFKHPHRDPARGIETSGGSLGMGLGYAAGLALALRRRGLDSRVFCVVGDGECDEGSIWESAGFAAFRRLDNLTVIVDANGMQLDGSTSDILDNGPIQRKFASFGFEVCEVDGHDVMALRAALRARSARPRVVVARTVKGKGLSFAEMRVEWHDCALDDELYVRAMEELDAREREICDE
ncbi:UTRA domain-containing protein [uncultured Olsenella sp.]|uniref:UTRA domain-containing protein n=1 Tax=uncultured Olsenella sp. TaxID=190764 RepID=UPI0026DBA577|nr:UTRA domain-containing protein [uncultured Olsenella sp.]